MHVVLHEATKAYFLHPLNELTSNIVLAKTQQELWGPVVSSTLCKFDVNALLTDDRSSKSGELTPALRLEVFETRTNFCQLTALNLYADTTHFEVLSTRCCADSREHVLCPILFLRCRNSSATVGAHKQFSLNNGPKGHKAMIVVTKAISCNNGEERIFK